MVFNLYVNIVNILYFALLILKYLFLKRMWISNLLPVINMIQSQNIFQKETYMSNPSNTKDQIREHNYFFAQQKLYDYINSRTADSLTLFLKNDMTEILNNRWEKTYADYINLDPDIEKLDSSGLAYTFNFIGNESGVAIITLPKPQALTESYYIGIYYHDENISPDSDFWYFIDPVEFRYFTLEYHDKRKSALCELEHSNHRNYGVRGILTAEEFLEAIKEIVLEI